MEKPDDKVRVHLRIEGRVQGVFFRACTQQEAIRLGLRGWVRNCPDGSVEVMAEGTSKKIEDLIGWCHQGPPGAHVHNVRLQWEDHKIEFPDFRIKR